MAAFETSGIEETMLSLKSIIEMPASVKDDMLNAQAKIVMQAQEEKARSMGVYDSHQPYPGKHVADTIKQGKNRHTSDGAYTYIYPQGSRTRGNVTTRQGEIAFINEFGKTGQPARPFIRTANEASADEAEEAAFKVYDNYLTSKDL